MKTLQLSLGVLCLFLCSIFDAKAQAEQLYLKGKAHLEQRNYAEAANYLFAFLESDAPSLNDASFKKSVKDGYKFAYQACSTALKDRPTMANQLQDCRDALHNCKNPGYSMVTQGLEGIPNPPEMPEIPKLVTGQSYPLLLKGGAKYTVTFKNKSKALEQPHIVISIPFKWTSAVGKNRENYQNMPDGTASWFDRPIAESEPSTILFPIKVEDLAFKTATSELEFSMFTFSGKLEFLNLLEQKGAYIVFSVSNDGKGHFIATGVPAHGK